MSNLWVRNIIRIVLFVLAQVLVFKFVDLGTPSFNYFVLIVYPVGILLLPLDTPPIATQVIALFVGLTVDIFYDSPGLHAAALVFMAFLRPTVLRALAPDMGYSKNAFPVANSFGLIWYLQYSGTLLFAFLLAYFSLEAFTLVYLKSILLKTFFSFIASFSMIILHQILINPKQ